jgi:hypothetical protein
MIGRALAGLEAGDDRDGAVQPAVGWSGRAFRPISM